MTAVRERQILVAGDGQRSGAATTASAARSPSGCGSAELPSRASRWRTSAPAGSPRLRGDARLRRPGAGGHSRQGGDPGTLYVMEVDPESRSRPESRTATILDPHDMDPQTVLRFVSRVNGWPGKVDRHRLRAGGDRGHGHGALDRRGGRGGAGGGPVLSTVRELGTDAGYGARARRRCTSSRSAGAIVATVERHARRGRVSDVRDAGGPTPPGGAGVARVLLRDRRARVRLRGRPARDRASSRRVLALHRMRARRGRSRAARSGAPSAGRRSTSR